MAASLHTMEKVFGVVKQYIPDEETRKRFLEDICKIRGNVSFTTTVGNILRMHEIEARNKKEWKK